MYDGTTISTGASVSLDGYISGPGESGFEHLFAYMAAGDVEVPTAQPQMTLRMTPENARRVPSRTNFASTISLRDGTPRS